MSRLFYCCRCPAFFVCLLQPLRPFFYGLPSAPPPSPSCPRAAAARLRHALCLLPRLCEFHEGKRGGDRTQGLRGGPSSSIKGLRRRALTQPQLNLELLTLVVQCSASRALARLLANNLDKHAEICVAARGNRQYTERNIPVQCVRGSTSYTYM